MTKALLLAFLHRVLVGVHGANLLAATQLVVALVVAGRATYAGIARALVGPGSHEAKLARVYSVCLGGLPQARALSSAIVHLILSQARGRVLLATDWTEFGHFKVLVTALLTPSRSIPLMWTVMPPFGEQTALEQSHFLELRALLPSTLEYVLVADRGFGHSHHVRLLTPLFSFVLRAKCKVGIRRPGDKKFTGLTKIAYEIDRAQDFGTVEYCASRTVSVRVVRMRDARHREPWLLLTNLAAPTRTVVRLYASRFRIEEMFRDYKDTRYGLHLRAYYVKQSASVDSLLVLVTSTYLVLELLGLHAKRRQWQLDYGRDVSRWRLGRIVALDARRAPLVKEHHLVEQIPHLLAKTGHWDWTPRPDETITEWPPIPVTATVRKGTRDRHVERACDLALRNRLYELLARDKRRQSDLARYLERRRSDLSLRMRGRVPVPASWISRLATFFAITEQELLADTHWVPSPRTRAKSGSSKWNKPYPAKP